MRVPFRGSSCGTVARATSTPASQTRVLQVYAAVNPDPAGPNQKGFIPEDLDREEVDHGQEGFGAHDHDHDRVVRWLDDFGTMCSRA